MKKILIIINILIIIFGFTGPVSASGFFNPNYIILDSELQDYDSMSLSDIYNFLQQKGSSLYDSYFDDYNAKRKSAAMIIYQAALENKINPKFILTVLQKEQSLIENSKPEQKNLDWATGYGICDNCSMDDPDIQDFKGFGKQVDYLARINRKYFDKPNLYKFQIDQTYDIDSFKITPANQATANMYNYTPHYEGNFNFWQLWVEYWAQDYPDGSLLQVEGSKETWYIQNNQRRLIASMSVLFSRFNPKKILIVTSKDLFNYAIGQPIKFPNYSILRSPAGKIYLLVDDALRYITSPKVFKNIGFSWDEVVDVGSADLAAYEAGEKITAETIYPIGALLQDKKTGGVFYVKDGIKSPIYSREIMKVNFPDRILTNVSPEELSEFSSGNPVLFRDGELIKSSGNPAVYVISDGQRRPIASGETFDKLGYKWDNIIITNQKALDIHPLGEPIQ